MLHKNISEIDIQLKKVLDNRKKQNMFLCFFGRYNIYLLSYFKLGLQKIDIKIGA